MEGLILLIAAGIISATFLYFIIKAAVRDGVIQALRWTNAEIKANSAAKDTLPQKKCPECSQEHDFDHHTCPHCEHKH